MAEAYAPAVRRSKPTMPQSPNYPFIDRMSGRSDDEFALEADLSVAERVARFAEARDELARIVRILASQDEPPARAGARDDVRRAKSVLENSLAFHASRLTEPELEQTLAAGEVEPELAQAIREQLQRLKPSRGRQRKRDR